MRAGPRLTAIHWIVLPPIAALWVFANIAALRIVTRQFPSPDWTNYYGAGATAGTAALLTPAPHHAWMVAHHFWPFPWVYMPGAAWLFTPLAHLEVAHAYLAFVALMTLAAAVSAVLLARIYRLRIGVALIGVFAWAPTTCGIIYGQSAPLGLLLEALGIAGIVTGSAWLAGVSIGLLLYKPPDAFAFILLLAARRSWRALSIVGLVAIGWYIASALAAAHDPIWLWHYLQAQGGTLDADIGEITAQAISIPKLLVRFHSPGWLVPVSTIALFALAVPKFVKGSALEAASIAPVVGIAASLHAWSHELTLILPTIFLFARYSNAAILLCYGIAATWVLWPVIGFNPEAIVVVGLTANALLRRSEHLARRSPNVSPSALRKA